MTFSSRVRWAMGLGLLGAVVVVQVSRGQGDAAVKKPAGATPPSRTFPPAVVGCIDLEAIFRGSEKAKFQNEQLKAEVAAKRVLEQRLMQQGRDIAKEMENLTPGTADFKDREKKLTELRASMQANKENAEREFEVRSAEYMASFYTDIQGVIKQVADYYGLTYVVRYTSEPVSAQDPQVLMARVQSPVIYARPDTDITRAVLYNLNQQYIASGGKVVKPPVDADAAPASGGTAPAAPANRPANTGTGTPRKK